MTQVINGMSSEDYKRVRLRAAVAKSFLNNPHESSHRMRLDHILKDFVLVVEELERLTPSLSAKAELNDGGDH